jgi:hypothetical protein
MMHAVVGRRHQNVLQPAELADALGMDEAAVNLYIRRISKGANPRRAMGTK